MTKLSVSEYSMLAVFSIVMSNVLFSPGCVLSTLGKLVIDRGSSMINVVVRVAHMYVNAKVIGPRMPAANISRKIKETW